MENQASRAHPDGYPHTINEVANSNDKGYIVNNEKLFYTEADVEAASNQHIDDTSDVVLHTEREIATHIISVDDDPSLDPWTFRAFFLGLGLSAFGGSLGMSISHLSLSSAFYTIQPRFITSNQ